VRIKTQTLCIILISLMVLMVFLLSLIISPFYVGGDQVHYRAVYERLPDLGIIEAFTFYSSSLSSLEMVHFFLSWLASRVVEKDLFVALSNAALAYATILLFRKWRVSLLITALFIFTNFYWFVLYFSAERLKFGILFLFLSILYLERIKVFCFLGFLALISHVQVILIYTSLLFQFVLKKLLRFFTTGLVSKTVLLVIFFALVPVFIMREQLMTKFHSYYEFREIVDLLKVFILLVLSLWYSRKRLETVLMFIPIIGAVLLVGGERVNVLGYFLFLYYALPVNRGYNFGILATSLYFMFSSFRYMENILKYGDGFYGN